MTLDLMLFIPYLVVASLLVSVGLIIFDTFFTKRETAAQVVARLKAKGIGSPEDIAKHRQEPK
jgi:hypothetical protein